ncbi:MAG: glycosyltransferase family 4 protein [Chitinophagaceae bacterium]|nr:glycosyltransferase family 4 protein [Chitinophagaceae bacterium]
MVKNEKPLRVLWFSITPGLSQHRGNNSFGGGGWIASLQHAVESSPDVELGFVFYSDDQLAPFTAGKTHYYPVRRIGYSKKTRLLNRVTRKTEYEENLPHFLQIIHDFKPDVIHVHGTESPFGLIVKHIRDIPVLISIQGVLTVYEKKYFAGLDMPSLPQQLKAGYPFFGVDYTIWKKRAKTEQEILKNAKYVAGRTDWDRRVCRVMAPDAHYFHVDEVLRKQFYDMKWEPRQDAPPIFFTTSSPPLYKGFETIVDTARILTENRIPFTWLVAGLKEKDALVRLVCKLRDVDSLEGLNIRLMGALSADELAKNLLLANAYVQVSHIENSPNSLCEAMMVGTPIIASFAGGTASLLQDRITGTLVQDGDPYSLAGAMMEIVRSPEDHWLMAAAARQTAHKRHDIPTVMDQLLTVYSTMTRLNKASYSREIPVH